MPNLPIRNLGAVGVVTDVDPFNLPFNAYTRAKNVRFVENNVERSPIYREILDLSSVSPAFVYGLYAQSGYDTSLIVTDQMDVLEFGNGSLASVYTGTTAPSNAPFTATSLANVEYINRKGATPLSRGPLETNFRELPNWPTGYSCGTLRSYGDFLIAMNTQEVGVEYPTRVRFSDLVLANNVPETWDELDLTNSAGFNDIVQMETPIVDGKSLGTNFYIYSSDQVWQMEFVGGQFIFNFRKIFDNCGVISQNCIVEVEGSHYVFDTNDIYIHDGMSKRSICENRVRDYIFNGLDKSKTYVCHVQHNPILEEIYFCYHSADDMAVYTKGDFCNRAAVYNYNYDTWSFMDLPNLVSGTVSNLNTVTSYDATIGLTYQNIGGSYHEQDSQFSRFPITISRSTADGEISKNRLLGIDQVDLGIIALPSVPECNKPMFLERVGIDLDEAQIPLSGYKRINRIYPQVSTSSTDQEIDFTFGAAQVPNDIPLYGSPVTFNIGIDYKVDSRMAGRYLSYRVSTDVPKDFSLSGFDLDLVITGRR